MAGGKAGQVILLRHGESVWNAQNRFTGWRDVALSAKGRAEAEGAAEKLRAAGIRPARAYTSALKRAQESCAIILDRLGCSDIPLCASAALNERDYGALTGMNKDEARARFGEEQIHLWRRSYEQRPPDGESLADTARRTVAFYQNHIRAHILPGAPVLITAHGNSLRALVMHLENLSGEQIAGREIATGAAHIYRLNKNGYADGAVQKV